MVTPNKWTMDYDSESIIDLTEDIWYALDNELETPDPDEHGFYPGILRITVEYIDE